MTENEQSPSEAQRPKRADALRNERTLLEAAASVFVTSGVDAPVREIAAEAGVGMGTIYRHFPTRSELVVAVYRHQVEACAEAGPKLLRESSTPDVALRAWVALFVNFLVTKHGLANALRGDSAGEDALHSYFVARLVPVCEMLLSAALAHRGMSRAESVDAYNLMKGVGNLCIGATSDPRYDAETLVQVLVSGVLGLRPRDERHDLSTASCAHYPDAAADQGI